VKRSATFSVTIGTTAVQILPRGVTRSSVIFFPDVSNRVTISNNPAPTLDNGVTIQAGQAPIRL
jgi:hypothetical protein